MHADASLINAIKRFDTEKALSPLLNQSPTKDNSNNQILSLAEALASTRKELENQGNRVRFLEESLKQERRARETAEERARHLLQHTNKPSEWDQAIEKAKDETFDTSSAVSAPPSDNETVADSNISGQMLVLSEASTIEDAALTTKPAEASAALLQERMNLIMQEMEEMKTHMEAYRRRAESSEAERNTLAAMVEKLREEKHSSNAVRSPSKDSRPSSSSSHSIFPSFANGSIDAMHANPDDAATGGHTMHTNGAAPDPAKQMEQLQTAVVQALTSTTRQGDRLAHTAPYASILGVVLLGVGLMTYLNGWPKTER